MYILIQNTVTFRHEVDEKLLNIPIEDRRQISIEIEGEHGHFTLSFLNGVVRHLPSKLILFLISFDQLI